MSHANVSDFQTRSAGANRAGYSGKGCESRVNTGPSSLMALRCVKYHHEHYSTV